MGWMVSLFVLKPIRYFCICVTTVFCTMCFAGQSIALDLIYDYEIVQKKDIHTSQDALQVAEAIQRLAAADVVGPFFFEAIEHTKVGDLSEVKINGILISLILDEFVLQRDVTASLSPPSSSSVMDSVTSSRTLIDKLDKRLKELNAFEQSAFRDTLVLRTSALRALALSAVDPRSSMAEALECTKLSLSGISQDSRAFALSFHALAWAQTSSSKSAPTAARTLIEWITKARAIFPAKDPYLAAAEIDVADKTAEGNRLSATIDALHHAEAAYEEVPDPLINISSAKDAAEIADDTKNAAIEYSYRLRFFKSLLFSAFAPEDLRELLLESYDPASVEDSETTSKAIKSALSLASSPKNQPYLSSNLAQALKKFAQ